MNYIKTITESAKGKIQYALNEIKKKAKLNPIYVKDNWHNWDYPRVKGYPLNKLTNKDYEYINKFFELSDYYDEYMCRKSPNIGVNKNEEMVFGFHNGTNYQIDLTCLGHGSNLYICCNVNELLSMLLIKPVSKIRNDKDMYEKIKILNYHLKHWLTEQNLIMECNNGEL